MLSEMKNAQSFIFGVLRFRDPALIYLLNGPKWLNLAGLGYDVVEPFKNSYGR